jgi:hypothetical protein
MRSWGPPLMQRPTMGPRFERILAHGAAIAVFLVTVAYLGQLYFQPDIGFSLHPRTFIVRSVGEKCAQSPTCVRPGDQVLRLGDLTLEEFRSNRFVQLHRGISRSELTPVLVRRDGVELTLEIDGRESKRAVLGTVVLWLLPGVFWFCGTFALLVVRPRSDRWLLLVLLFYSTAIWVSAGHISVTRAWYSGFVYNAFAWLFVPLLIHLHLVLPRRVAQPTLRVTTLCVYGASALFFLLSTFGIFSGISLFIGLGVAILVSLLRLGLLSIGRSTLSELVLSRLLLAGATLGLFPVVALSLVALSLTSFGSSALMSNLIGISFLLVFPIWPLTYLYALYKLGAGVVEFRANRVLATYGFFSIFVTLFLATYLVAQNLLAATFGGLGTGLAVSLAFVCWRRRCALWFSDSSTAISMASNIALKRSSAPLPCGSRARATK